MRTVAVGFHKTGGLGVELAFYLKTLTVAVASESNPGEEELLKHCHTNKFLSVRVRVLDT